MSNIVEIVGAPPAKAKLVSEMQPGDIGYIVPWAVQGENLRTEYAVVLAKSDLRTVRVECVRPGKFRIIYEG